MFILSNKWHTTFVSMHVSVVLWYWWVQELTRGCEFHIGLVLDLYWYELAIQWGCSLSSKMLCIGPSWYVKASFCEKLDVKTMAATLALAYQHSWEDACLEFVTTSDVMYIVIASPGYKNLKTTCSSARTDAFEKALWFLTPKHFYFIIHVRVQRLVTFFSELWTIWIIFDWCL